VSSTDNPIALPQAVVGEPLSLRQLTEVLVKHYGLHEGLYDAMIEYQIGVGNFGLNPENPENSLPGAVMGVVRVGLVKTDKPSSRSVDAAISNPLPVAHAPKKSPAKKTRKSAAK